MWGIKYNGIYRSFVQYQYALACLRELERKGIEGHIVFGNARRANYDAQGKIIKTYKTKKLS